MYLEKKYIKPKCECIIKENVTVYQISQKKN